MYSPLRRYTKHHDVIGIWHIPNVKMRHPATGSKPWYVRTNSAGLRDDRELSQTKPQGVTRITLLGDSFTFGYSVEVEERYSTVLEQSFAGLEVVNFGLCSAGIDQEFLIYREIASAWESDVLMISPYLNNVGRCQLAYHMFQDQAGGRHMTPKPYFELDGDDLALKNVPVIRRPTAEQAAELEAAQAGRAGTRNVEANPQRRVVRLAKQAILERRLKYLMIKVLPVQPYGEYVSADAPEWRLAKRILQELRAISKQKHVVISPLPAWSVVLNPSLATYRDRFAELHDPAGGVHVLDILPTFLELSFADRVRCFVSTRDTHYSAFGHRVAARGMAEELEKTGVLGGARRI